MTKYKFYVSTGFVGAKRAEIVEIPDEELKGMDSIQKDNYIYESYYKHWLEENAEMNFHEEKEGKNHDE